MVSFGVVIIGFSARLLQKVDDTLRLTVFEHFKDHGDQQIKFLTCHTDTPFRYFHYTTGERDLSTDLR